MTGFLGSHGLLFLPLRKLRRGSFPPSPSFIFTAGLAAFGFALSGFQSVFLSLSAFFYGLPKTNPYIRQKEIPAVHSRKQPGFCQNDFCFCLFLLRDNFIGGGKEVLPLCFDCDFRRIEGTQLFKHRFLVAAVHQAENQVGACVQLQVVQST